MVENECRISKNIKFLYLIFYFRCIIFWYKNQGGIQHMMKTRLKEGQKILFSYDFYQTGEEEIYDGVITLVKEKEIHVSFLLKFRPVHQDIPKNKIIAIFDRRGKEQEIGSYHGTFVKVS